MAETVARLNAALEGRYRIERVLGEGGMATVYLADDPLLIHTASTRRPPDLIDGPRTQAKAHDGPTLASKTNCAEPCILW